MAARLTKKNELKDTPQVSPSQHKQAEGRFRLQVDRQTKATYATLEAAEAAGLAIKKSHPLVHVGVYDHLESVNKVISVFHSDDRAGDFWHPLVPLIGLWNARAQ